MFYLLGLQNTLASPDPDRLTDDTISEGCNRKPQRAAGGSVGSWQLAAA